MTPYKGIVRIECGRIGSCPSKRRGDVKAICVQCQDAVIEILDLDGKTLARNARVVEDSKLKVPDSKIGPDLNQSNLKSAILNL